MKPTIDNLIDIYCTQIAMCIYCKEPIMSWQDRYTQANDKTKSMHYDCALMLKPKKKSVKNNDRRNNL